MNVSQQTGSAERNSAGPARWLAIGAAMLRGAADAGCARDGFAAEGTDRRGCPQGS